MRTLRRAEHAVARIPVETEQPVEAYAAAVDLYRHAFGVAPSVSAAFAPPSLLGALCLA